jgi:hypothetical protein
MSPAPHRSPEISLDTLRRTALTRTRSWHAVSTRHDLLLRIAAYPPTAAHRDEALHQLDQIATRVRQLPAAARERGNDSGIAGTRAHDPYDLGMARWLSTQYPLDVEIDWSQLSDATILQDLLRPALQPAELDGFDSDHLSLRAWVRAARSADAPSDLRWILHSIEGARRTPALLAASWESAAVPLVWHLRHASATTARLEHDAEHDAEHVVLRTTMRTLPQNPTRHISRPLANITRLPRAAADRVITVARTTLAARCREVHAISYANHNEVWLAPLGAGAELAIIGVVPEHRLTLEANYGYILFSNGIPVGYGGVSPLFRQANTGINIFSAFRGTEAGFLWAQMLRAFRTLFDVRRFIVNPFQIGGGNAEALRSGAFWFHYRLGFRPATAALRELAATELARMRTQAAYRTPLRTLRRLASADLHLTLPGFDERDAFDESWLPQLSVLVSRQLGRAAGASERRVARSTANAPSLAPFAALLPDLSRWPHAERRQLRALLNAKDAPVEREFVRAAQEHPRFYRGLISLARQHLGTPSTSVRPATSRR